MAATLFSMSFAAATASLASLFPVMLVEAVLRQSIIDQVRGVQRHVSREHMSFGQRTSLRVQSMADQGVLMQGVQQGGARSSDPKGATWFGEFAQAESTYTDDLPSRETNPDVVFADGWTPRYKTNKGAGEAAARFHESPSAGDGQAWQTHFPALGASVSGDRSKDGVWYIDGGGEWMQDYKSMPLAKTPHTSRHLRTDASWFDSSVAQYDGFGREKMPGPSSAKRLAGWAEKSVNTTLTCEKPGCNGSAALQAFDASTEQAKNCRLSFHVHPTDFDDRHSGERLVFIHVNNAAVNTDCFPDANGCADETLGDVNPKSLFPCVLGLPVDHLMNFSTGLLTISAGISDVVDECPYSGNMLSAVPMVTCMVAPMPLAAAAAPVPVMPVPLQATGVGDSVVKCFETPLQCPERNCTAESSVIFPMVNGESLDGCRANLTFMQTDFDGDEGSIELINFATVGNETLGTDLPPGKNPCKSKFAGTPLSEVEMEYAAVTDKSIEAAQNGVFNFRAKISELVDECASEGYLLNGKAKVCCTATFSPQEA